ncbi:hypothetical protein ABZ876_06080 [Streptomyces sp. NPDC046931]|uniref:hypothetical protein n=1 Tax=Streptomyces sp. NPDC046931 TaxID=3154806 RepID=UPI0034058364
MPRRWSLGVDRIHSDGLDGDYDRLKKTAKAHKLHDSKRDAKPTRTGRTELSGPSDSQASSPQKRRWGR